MKNQKDNMGTMTSSLLGSVTTGDQRLERAAKAIARTIPFNDSGWIEPHGHDFPNQYTDDEQKKVRAIAAQAIQAYLNGDVVVPREPTEAQLVACYEMFGCHEMFRPEDIDAPGIYRAMIRAATDSE